MAKIPRRKRFFIACEGESEQGYAALLQKFANDAGQSIHIVAKVMIKAGDPLAMTERAAATIRLEEGGSKPTFVGRFLLFDTDLIGKNPGRDGQMIDAADKAKLTLIRQNICFESFLLRHFDGHENDDPATNLEALNRLKGVWPEYRKGTSAQDLAKQIQLEDTQKASKSPLNSDFAALLTAIGLND
jgi:hypothetical protein